MLNSVKPWSGMDKAERIAAIIYAHNVTDGTAASISAYLSQVSQEQVTRSAVIGFYSRNPDTLRATFPLTGHQIAAATYRVRKQRAVAEKKIPAPRPPRPMPAPVKVDIDKPEPKLKFLWEIEACECKWPVDGDRAETRFCCAPAAQGAAYCTYHTKRGTQAIRAKAKPAISKQPARMYR